MHFPELNDLGGEQEAQNNPAGATAPNANAALTTSSGGGGGEAPPFWARNEYAMKNVGSGKLCALSQNTSGVENTADVGHGGYRTLLCNVEVDANVDGGVARRYCPEIILFQGQL